MENYYDIPKENSLDSMEGVENKENIKNEEKVKIVPIEELIPDIKPVAEISVESLPVSGNKFPDSFIYSFLRSFELSGVLQMKGLDSDLEESKLDIIRKRFKNKVVLDIGAGENSLGYFLAQLLGAKGYVGVEMNNAESLVNSLENYSAEDFEEKFKSFFPNKRIPDFELIPASVVKASMLETLKRIPTNSVNIFSFGLDNALIPNIEYTKQVEEEMNRVLSEEGAFIRDPAGSLAPKGVVPLVEYLKDESSGNSRIVFSLLKTKKWCFVKG